MIARSLTCDNIASVAYVANLAYILYAVGTGGVVRSLVSARPFPATLPGDLERETRRALHSERDTGSCRGHGGAGYPAATFRAAFIQELRARREQTGLTQREFVERARVSHPGEPLRTWRSGPPTGRRPKGASFPVSGAQILARLARRGTVCGRIRVLRWKSGRRPQVPVWPTAEMRRTSPMPRR
jgi:transcriptional regulator with XRE-family HTH domain